MEIFPKGNFLSIWQLLFQIKVHKENIRTQCEISEVHSEPDRTSKMKLFAKMLNAFQLLYTDAYSEPSRSSKMALFVNS